MLIDATHAEETRIVVVDGKRLVDFDFETATKRQLKGNIYLAKVTRVEPSLQAAFVDYGGNRHGFLAFNEIHPDYYQIPVADREALLADEAEQAARQAELEDRVDENNDCVESVDKNESEPVIAEGDEAVTLNSDDAEGYVSGPFNSEAMDAIGDEYEGEENSSAGAVDVLDEVPRPRARSRRSYKIQEVIKRRQILLIQVVKEERGNKGAALTTYLSLAGRYCVLMPNTARGGGISRKISNQTARRKLKKIVSDLDVPEGMGVIVRTAGQNRTKAEIRRDFEYLLRLWDSVRDLTLDSSAPTVVYEEADLIKRAIRDMYSKDFDEVLVDGDDGYRVAKDFMRMLMPSHAKKVQPYRDRIPLLHRYQVEQQLDSMHSNVVQLKSGGYIVFAQTEALVAVDVNSGRSTKERNIEETALKTNLEAAAEIGRQLRLRDLAGLVVIDFIDMDENRNDRAVERRIKEALKDDRARIQVGRISTFGLMELSRQRLRPSLFEASTKACDVCSGTGFVRTTESTALHVLRAVEEEGIRGRASQLSVHAPVDVSLYLLNQKRDHLAEIEQRYGLHVYVQGDATLVAPDCRVTVDQARTPQEIEAIAKERKRSAEEIALADEENDASDIETIDGGEFEKPTERRPRRRRRSRKRSEDRKTEGNEQDVVETEVEGAHDQANDEVGETDPNGEDKPRRRRRGRRGGRRRRANGDPAEQSESVGQKARQNIQTREAPTDAAEEVAGNATNLSSPNQSGSQDESVQKDSRPSDAERVETLDTGKQRTSDTPNSTASASFFGTTEPTVPTSSDASKPVNANSEAVPVISQAPDQPEAEAASKPTSLPASNTKPINEQRQVIGSNEVATAPEETPAESIKTKRRGWWQRGRLF